MKPFCKIALSIEMYAKCYFPYLINVFIILNSNKIVIRSHLEIKGNVLLYFFTVVKIFLDPTVFLPQIFKLFWAQYIKAVFLRIRICLCDDVMPTWITCTCDCGSVLIQRVN